MKKAILDIDGVLNDYPQTQIDFYNATHKKKVKTLKEMKDALSYNEYKAVKESYRKSSYKYDCKPKEHAQELITYLRKSGYLIYLITARKLFENNQLEKTIMWLKKNNLHYDYIYCTQKKDVTVFDKFGEVDLVVEDNSDNINNIIDVLGTEANYFLITNKENKNKIVFPRCNRVKSLQEIIAFLEEQK